MVKRAVAAACMAAGAVTAAHAQSSVVLYGSLDAGVGYVSNVAGSTKVLMIQGNTQPDRWGLRGREDLGGGLAAIFQLENGFYTNTGAFATANTLWNRAAYVGLASNRYGTITLGRQTPLQFDWLDPLSTAYLAMSWYAFHPGNIDGLAATGNVPYNNAIKLKSPSWGGFTAAATLALGNTTNFGTGAARPASGSTTRTARSRPRPSTRTSTTARCWSARPASPASRGKTPPTAIPPARWRTSARAPPTRSATGWCTRSTRA